MLVFLYSLVSSKNKTKKIIICTSIQIQNHRAPYLKLNRRAKSAIPLSLLIFFSLVSFGGIPLPSIQYIRQHYFFFFLFKVYKKLLNYGIIKKKKQYWLINMGLGSWEQRQLFPGSQIRYVKERCYGPADGKTFFFFQSPRVV